MQFGLKNGPKLIATADEQSYPCPYPQCGIVHTQPFIKKCDRPFAEPLRPDLPPTHHVCVLPLDGKATTLGKAVAAHLLGPEIVTETQLVQPLDPHSYRVFAGKQIMRLGAVALGSGGPPIGVRLPGAGSRLYVHGISIGRMDALNRNLRVGECGRSTVSLIRRLMAADTVSLAVSCDSALDRKSREVMEAHIEALTKELRNPHEVPKSPSPILVITLVDEQRLAESMGVDRLPGLEEANPTLLASYILDGLRLREIVRPFVDAHSWAGFEALCFRTPLDLPLSVSGLQPWLRRLT